MLSWQWSSCLISETLVNGESEDSCALVSYLTKLKLVQTEVSSYLVYSHPWLAICLYKKTVTSCSAYVTISRWRHKQDMTRTLVNFWEPRTYRHSWFMIVPGSTHTFITTPSLLLALCLGVILFQCFVYTTFTVHILRHSQFHYKWHRNLIWKSPGFVTFGTNLIHFRDRSAIRSTISRTCLTQPSQFKYEWRNTQGKYEHQN